MDSSDQSETRTTTETAAQSVEDTLHQLAVDPSVGLASDEVTRRLQQYGPNEVREHEQTLLQRILRRFWGPIPWMIEVAALLSGLARKWEDLVIILIMLFTNAVLDFLQEHRALNALKALQAHVKRMVSARRDGEFKAIEARDLVPGDIIRLKIGDVVPADLQLVGDASVSIDQSALTGESLPVRKQSGDVAYANTVVKQGDTTAVVVNTAASTRFHSVVALVARAQLEERSHFQKMVINIGNFLILLTIALVTLIAVVAIFRHESLIELVRFALVLTVAAIPVALPAVLSVTMAVGAMNLARRQAVVSKLTAIEELAGVDIFCADKTGTLTQNQMHVAEPVTIGSHTEQELFLTAALASRDQDDDPIEKPIFAYIKEHHPDIDWQGYEVRKFVPFDPTIKRTEATVEKDGNSFVAMKGAAQVLMSLSDLDDARATELSKKVDELAGGGYRTLAVGRREPESDVVDLIGLIPLYDPPRNDSKRVIEEMNANGVEVKMVTGDNLAIAREIGRLLGLPQRTLPASALSGGAGAELLDLTKALTTAIYSRLQPGVSQRDARQFANDVMASLQESYDTRMLEHEFLHTHESALVEIIEEASIFAEVIPEDKFRIVDSLQKRGHIVGMTGDGVNDAPALKRADCGIAVSGATDAARAAADIILTGPGLDVINAAIVQARTTFGRMKSYATFRIAETVRIILFMTLSIIVFEFYPITPLMIILLALLNDIPILAIAYDHTKIEKRPVRWNMTSLLAVSVTLGLMGVLASFLLYYIVKEYGFSDDIIRTLMFLKLIVAGHSTLYVTRVEGAFFRRPFPSPLLFGATFATEILGTLIAVFGIMVTPIPWTYALLIWAYALAWFVVNDMVKIAVVKLLHQGDRNDEPRQAAPETAG